MSSSPLLAAALAYAARGWPVFPLVPRAKVPLAGSSGANDATTDPDTIRRWWAATPTANIGIATGQRAGFFVLDIDPRNTGDETLQDWENEYGSLPDTAESVTGGGGRQLLFAYPDGGIRSSTGTARNGRPGIDVKGDGGYIVAPPSIHPSGKTYEWEISNDPTEGATIAQAPAWLLDPTRAIEPGGAGAIEATSPLKAALRTGSIARGVALLRPVTGSIAPYLSPADVVSRCTCGPGERDGKVLELARGLKWNAEIDAVDEALPHFWRWHSRSAYGATEKESEKQFRRAWVNAAFPLDLDVPAWAMELARDDEPPGFTANYHPKASNKVMLVMLCRRMQQIRSNTHWWIRCIDAGRLIGCSEGQALRLFQQLENADPPVLKCVRRGIGMPHPRSMWRTTLYRYVAEGLATDADEIVSF